MPGITGTSNQGGGGSTGGGGGSSDGLEIVNQINNVVNISLDNTIRNLIGTIDNQIEQLAASSRSADNALMSRINDTIRFVETNNTNIVRFLSSALDANVRIIAQTNQQIIQGLLNPVLNNLSNMQAQELAQDRLQQISLERLLNLLIQSQNNQTRDINNKLESINNELIEALENIDYVREDNLADWIKQALEPLRVRMVTNDFIVNEDGTTTDYSLWDGLKNTLGFVTGQVDRIGDVFTKLEQGTYESIDEVKRDLFGGETLSDIAEGMFGVVMMKDLFGKFGEALYADTLTNLNFLAIRSAKPARFTPHEAYRMLRKGVISDEDFRRQILDSGFSEYLSDAIKSSATRDLELGDLFELYRRGIYDENTLKRGLRYLGFSDSVIEQLPQLAMYQAPPQDIIRFMVRDVFDAAIIEDGGLEQGWDNPKYLELMRKVGVNDELSRLYWMAHFIIPSVNQGYEMFQREIITLEQLEQLFVAADIAPKWRERLLGISYNLPTRVDARRAYEDGIITDEKMQEYIRHSGVHPEWQQIIYDWHVDRKIKVQASRNKVKRLTDTQIAKAWQNGLLTWDEAISRLTENGFSDNDALIFLRNYVATQDVNDDNNYHDRFINNMRSTAIEGYRTRTLSRQIAFDMLRNSNLSEELSHRVLDLTDRQYSLDRKAEIVSITRKMFISHDVSETEFYALMNREGFTQEEIESHIQDVRPLRNLRFRELTRADIKKGATQTELGIEWGKERLRGLGYSETTITEIMLIEAWDDSQNSISVNG